MVRRDLDLRKTLKVEWTSLSEKMGLCFIPIKLHWTQSKKLFEPTLNPLKEKESGFVYFQLHYKSIMLLLLREWMWNFKFKFEFCPKKKKKVYESTNLCLILCSYFMGLWFLVFSFVFLILFLCSCSRYTWILIHVIFGF